VVSGQIKLKTLDACLRRRDELIPEAKVRYYVHPWTPPFGPARGCSNRSGRFSRGDDVWFWDDSALLTLHLGYSGDSILIYGAMK